MNQKRGVNLKKFTIGLLLIATMAMLLMVGCGDSRNEALVGRWVWEDDTSWITTFNADGTGTHAVSWGYGTTFQWTTPSNNIRWNYPNHPNMDTPYRISGDALYITTGDGMTFRYVRG